MALLTRNWNLSVVLVAFALWLASTGVGARSPPESAVGQEAGNGTLEEKVFNPIGAINIEYDLAKGRSYAGLQSHLRQVLATSRTVDGIPVLVAQTLPGPPPTWILITITSGPRSAKVTVAVRNDNIYVAGFNNTAGIWFAFRRFKDQVKGSVKLPKKEDYGSLIGGHQNLARFDVSRQAVLRAVRFLSTYTVVKDKTQLGISLARLIVVVAEAARFKPIYETVEQGLKEDQALMTEKEARLVVLWGKMSKWLMTGEWPNQDSELEKAGINSKQDAIDSLKLLIRPKDVKVQHLGVAGNGTFCNNATSFCN